MKIDLNCQNMRGSVLVVSLLLLVAGTVGMASLTSLLSHRSSYVMNMELGIQRRIALRNSRALVQHYFMRQGIANSAPGGILDIGAWGKVTIPETVASPLNSNQEFSLVNFLSPGFNQGFTEDVTVTIEQPVPYDLGGAVTLTDYTVQLKSRSPLLAGNLLVQHNPMNPVVGVETDLQGSIQVNGNAVLWRDSDLSGSDITNLRVKSYDHPDMISVNIKNLSGTHVPPTNFPFYPRTTGYSDLGSLGAPVTDGRSNMMQIGTYPVTPPDPDILKKQNTIHHKMVANSFPTEVNGTFDYTIGAVSGDEIGGERRITINLNNPGLSPVIVNDGVYHVVLQGYTDSIQADDEPPGFILLRSNELKTITLENNNFRRTLIGIDRDVASTIPVTVSLSGGATDWRLLLTAEKVGLSLNLGSTLTVQGGIRTDSRLSVTSGSLVLNRETNPEPLELMDPREGWIEIYRGL